jgi:hypothetical protein
MTRWTEAQFTAHTARAGAPPMPVNAKSRREARAPRPTEADIHAAVVDALRRLARPGVVWWHTPNGERRDARDGAKLARFGVRAGMPDLFVLIAGRLYGLELKRFGGRLSAAQRDMHMALTVAGATVTTAASIDDALVVLRRWGAIR